MVRRVPPFSWIVSTAGGRPLTRTTSANNAFHDLAQQNEQHRADVRMRADSLQHFFSVAVRIAAGKTEQKHGRFDLRIKGFDRVEGWTKMRGDLARDV
jgi:hypothetical protein